MDLNESTLATLLVVALAVAAVALVAAGVALVGQQRVRTAYRKFSQGSRDDVLTLLQRHIDEVRELRREVAALRDYADGLRDLQRMGLSRLATVRYDAFDDMGGRMSFSTALLDEHGDGVVLTSINGRTETRTYAKPVTAGRSRHNLSEEEVAAIERALSMAGRTAGTEVDRRPAKARRTAGTS